MSTLPIRNGNRASKLPMQLPITSKSEYLTYKEWKRIHVFAYMNPDGEKQYHCEYLTYKEWKHNYNSNNVAWDFIHPSEYLTYKEWKPIANPAPKQINHKGTW